MHRSVHTSWACALAAVDVIVIAAGRLEPISDDLCVRFAASPFNFHLSLLLISIKAVALRWRIALHWLPMLVLRSSGVCGSACARASSTDIGGQLVPKFYRLEVLASEFLFASIACGLAPAFSYVISLDLALLTNPAGRDTFRSRTGFDRDLHILIHSNSATTANT
jgi:hypothetical protein